LGPRPEEETNTGFYDSKVQAGPLGGKAVAVGEVSGPNRAGDTKIEIKKQFESFKSKQGDPLIGKRLPKAHREHVREYISSFQGSE